ncbi:MAG: hypothetical protein H8D47_03720, partial [Planctomycetes bacterium]|nr:hypothetical protein [Planctomycetota bacterium]
MRIKYKILFLMALLIIFVSALFTFFSYRIVNENLLNSIDQKLLSAAHNAKVVVNSNYHDNITDANSVTNNRYREITEKYTSLCYGLKIHSLISLLLIDDKLVYTSSMDSDSEHGEYFFFKEHPHPKIFADSLDKIEIEFSSRPKPWGIE